MTGRRRREISILILGTHTFNYCDKQSLVQILFFLVPIFLFFYHFCCSCTYLFFALLFALDRKVEEAFLISSSFWYKESLEQLVFLISRTNNTEQNFLLFRNSFSKHFSCTLYIAYIIILFFLSILCVLFPLKQTRFL